MAAVPIAEYLKFANLQTAAEAILNIPETGERFYSGQDLERALVRGNTRSLKFTQPQAEAFADPVKGWTVLDQKANTSTGFSATLFFNSNTDEYVLSLRSTEFIDDALRDSYGTNKVEIVDRGWAFGQIADMEAWYGRLKETGKLPAGAHFSVTGYSLGEHPRRPHADWKANSGNDTAWRRAA